MSSHVFLLKISGEERTYFSSDSIDPTDTRPKDDAVLCPEFLNSIKMSGMPNHSLRLRISTSVMLLRNLDPNEGLCNGTRLQITQMAQEKELEKKSSYTVSSLHHQIRNSLFL